MKIQYLRDRKVDKLTMKKLVWGVFIYTNLFSSLTNGQNYNRTVSRTCGDCQPENCPIPRQCLAGKFFLIKYKNVEVTINLIK